MRTVIALLVLASFLGATWLLLGDPTRPPAGAGAKSALPPARPRAPRLAPADPKRFAAVAPSEGHVQASGVILDRLGRPVPGARVGWTAGEIDVPSCAVTDDKGRYSFPFPGLRARRLVVEARDGRRAWIRLEEQDPKRTRVRLPDVRPLEGVVYAADGRTPVGGAMVRMWAYRFGQATAMTRSDGSWRLDAVPIDRTFTIHVEARSRGRTSVPGVRWAADTPIEIELPPVWTISGRVVRKDGTGTLAGVEGIRVCLRYGIGGTCSGGCRDPVADLFQGVVTATDGSFVYPGCTCPGPLGAHDAAGECLSAKRMTWTGDATVEIELRAASAPSRVVPLSGPTTSFTGAVIDEEGRPVPDAHVQLRTEIPGGGYTEALTDDWGSFRIEGLGSGERNLVVDAWGHETHLSVVSLAQPESSSREPIRLRRLHERHGRVVDDEGTPIPTASVAGYRTERDGVPVAADGTFTTQVRANRDFSISASAPGYATEVYDRDRLPPEGPWALVLERMHAVEGRVVDRRGEPIRSARIRGRGRGDRWGTGVEAVRADIAGRFRLEVPHEGAYDLFAYAPGHVFANPEPVTTGSGRVEIRAVVSTAVEGLVVDPHGRGIAGVTVGVTATRGIDTEYDTTDDHGCFRVDGLGGAAFEIDVSSLDDTLQSRYLGVRLRENVPAGTTDLVLVAERLRRISGTVTWPDGTPAADVRVSRADAKNWVETDERGAFVLERVFSGQHVVEAWIWDDEDRYHEARAEDVPAGADDLLLVLQSAPADP